MIAPRTPNHQQNSNPAWHAKFLELLPGIRRYARHAFRRLPVQSREELVEEAVANSLVAFVHLVVRGKVDLAYATPLAMYATRQIRAGRRIGAKLNIRDVSSPYAQLAKDFRLERLDHFDSKADEWREIVIEDKRATPADVARVRIDFDDWLHALSGRQRQIARLLASGEATRTVARRFHVSDGRVSQLRKELANSWLAFQGERPSNN
jgi:DNA-binding CsgD family transcriptional regulator